MGKDYLIFGVAHFDNVLGGDKVGKVDQSINRIEHRSTNDWDRKFGNIESIGCDQMLGKLNQLISSISDQIGLENHIIGHKDSCKTSSCERSHLPEFEPFENSSILVDHFTLFKV